MRKKIIFYTMTMKRGGTETTIANLANYFINGYDITIVTNIKCDCEYKLNSNIKLINIDEVDKSNEKFIKKIVTKLSNFRTKKLKEIFNIEKPDLIISFLPEPIIRSLRLKKYFNMPIICSLRNHPKYEYYYLLLKYYYYNKADKIIIQGDKYKKYFLQKDFNKIVTIPNYISSDFIIDNDSGLAELRDRVDRLLKQLKI